MWIDDRFSLTGNLVNKHWCNVPWPQASSVLTDHMGLLLNVNLLVWVLLQDTAEQLETVELESRSSDTTVWFGHYPTSIIYNSQPLTQVLR